MSPTAYPERYGPVLTFAETIMMDCFLLPLSLNTVKIIWQYNLNDKWTHKQRTQFAWQTCFASHVFLVHEVPFSKPLWPCFQVIIFLLGQLGLSQMLSCLMMHLLHPRQQRLQILALWQLLTPWQPQQNVRRHVHLTTQLQHVRREPCTPIYCRSKCHSQHRQVLIPASLLTL